MLVNIIIPIINHDTITGEQQYINIDISDITLISLLVSLIIRLARVFSLVHSLCNKL